MNQKQLQTIYQQPSSSSLSVLVIGRECGPLLSQFSPDKGVGVVQSNRLAKSFQKKYPKYQFVVDGKLRLNGISGKYDLLIVEGVVEYLWDIQTILERSKKFLKKEGKLVIGATNFWRGITASLLDKLLFKPQDKKPVYVSNWHLRNLLEISGFEIIKAGFGDFLPLPILSQFVDRLLAPIPLVRELAKLQYFVARTKKFTRLPDYSCSVVIPCFNEEDNVVDCVKQVPKIGRTTEIIIVDDGSTDKTAKKARAMLKNYPNLKVISYKPNKGKVQAVKAGFDAASSDIVMIWDADRTVPADELARFYQILKQGLAKFVMGTRMIYPMETQAMKAANFLGNAFFGKVYSWILSTPISDTLCGTKALFKKDYKKIPMGTEPWGDFDLLFGAGHLRLPIREVPVHYGMRIAGQSKMRAFRYGLVVAKMSLRGIWEFKLQPIFKKKIDLFAHFVSQHYWLLAIVIVAASLRFTGLAPNLIGHPDEAHTQRYAKQLAANALIKGDFDPHTYKYGSVIFYLQAMVATPILLVPYWWEQFTDISKQPTSFLVPFEEYLSDIGPHRYRDLILVAGRGVSAFFGTLSVVVIYAIGKKLFNKKVGLLSALILAINPFHVRESHYITTDVLSLFFTLLAILSMVYVWQSGKWRWYLVSGFLIGFSSVARYFPITLLVYPLAVLLDSHKNRWWMAKIVVGILMVPLGAWAGVPYLPLSQDNRAVFQHEMENLILPFYSTTISTYATSLASYIMTFGQTPLPPFSSLAPGDFLPFHASFLYHHGLTPPVALVMILGLITAAIRYLGPTLLLLIIPLTTFVYASFYLKSVYERTTLPVVPFVAIFTAIGLFLIWETLVKLQLSTKVKKSVFVAVVVLVLGGSFYSSASSSWACGQKTIIQQGQDWIDQNIALDAKVAYQQAGISFPSKPFTNLKELHPQGDFSMEEVRLADNDYAFIHGGALGYYTYRYINDFFTPPEDLYQNSYIPLALHEYQSRALLLARIEQPFMCNGAYLLFYKLSSPLPEATEVVKKFTFDHQDQLSEWSLQKYPTAKSEVTMVFNPSEGKSQPGALEYRWSLITYTAPRIVSSKIPVKGSQVYTLKGWAKSAFDLASNERDGFLRIDFYDHINDVTTLPGDSVALTPRAWGKSEWREMSVTTRAPQDAVFATISLQLSGSKNVSYFLFDEIMLSKSP